MDNILAFTSVDEVCITWNAETKTFTITANPTTFYITPQLKVFSMMVNAN